jgi:hypothetical protein
MPPTFIPPNRDSLAELDRAEGVAYEDTCTLVEGVISPRSQGGWCGSEPGYDVHSFELAVWRRRGEALVERSVLVMRPVPPFIQSRLSFDPAIFKEYPAFSIQRLSLLLSKDQTRAVFDKVLPFDAPDASLAQLANRLRQPSVVSTALFGNLTLDPTIDWFEGKTTWNGKMISLHVEKSPDDRIDDALKTAAYLWSDQITWKRKVDELAIGELLRIKNDFWLSEGEPKLTSKQFKARMKLVAIWVEFNGRFSFSHFDDDMFCGHLIKIRGSVEDGLTEASIEG